MRLNEHRGQQSSPCLSQSLRPDLESFRLEHSPAQTTRLCSMELFSSEVVLGSFPLRCEYTGHSLKVGHKSSHFQLSGFAVTTPQDRGGVYGRDHVRS